MTLAPAVNPTIRGVKGPPGKMLELCIVPGCPLAAQQRHHYWPKSYLRGQPYEWVTADGVLLQNSGGMCIGHHTDVSSPVGGHKAHVRWNGEDLEWWVNDADLQGGWTNYGPVKTADDVIVPTQRTASDVCPTCGHRHKKKESNALPKRKVKSWSVSVPDDAEDGAAVLDEYIDDLSVALGFGDESKGVRRFHVLANVLLWVVQMKPEFLADWNDADAA